MNKRHTPDNYHDKGEAMRLVYLINKHWMTRGYPEFKAHLEEYTLELPSGKKQLVYNVRSNIKIRATP